MNPLLTVAVDAARAAGKIIVKGFERPDLIKVSKKQNDELVTDIDERAEAMIIDTIHKSFPQHATWGEESGEVGRHDFTWIIDPLDGTKNFIHNIPHFAISIAIQNKGQIEHGVIYDPLRDELFTASKGRGAILNKYRLRAMERPMNETIVGFTYPILATGDSLDLATKTARFSATCRSIRKMGCAVLDLAYLASSRLDIGITNHLKIWDYAAGVLIAQEAGCLVSNWEGGEHYAQTGQLLITAPKLQKAALKLMS